LQTALWVARRGGALLAVTVVPLLGCGLASLAFWLPAWLASWPAATGWAELLSLLAFPLALLAGLLAFGALFAFPLSWVAVLCEPEADAFDAISRGYEYTYRRPFHLLGYLLAAWLLARVLLLFANGICFASARLALACFPVAAESPQLPAGASLLSHFLTQLPTVFAALLFWTLFAGIYLLMRRATNGQEVEEVGGGEPGGESF
jgi:hypothetical protein